MANEATIHASLQIAKTDTPTLSYRSYPTQFTATVTGAKGPTPGAFTAAVTGTDVDLSELSTPGLVIFKNLDDTNFVTVGIWDGANFFPFMELKPGEFFPLRFSRYVGEEFATGTGTTGSGNTVRVYADTAPCNVDVQAFEA